MSAPCYKCKDRVAIPPCRTTCEKYKMFRKVIEVENEKRRQAQKAEHDWFAAKGKRK